MIRKGKAKTRWFYDTTQDEKYKGQGFRGTERDYGIATDR